MSHDPPPSHDQSLDSPSSVASRAFTAYEAAHWGDFASLVHGDALGEFRRRQLAMTEAWEHAPAVGSARDVAGADDLERAFDEHFSASFGNPSLHFFAGVATVDELRALSPAELLARFLEGQAPRARPDDPEYQSPVDRREVIGEVAERPDLVHVVYRVRTDVGRYGRTEEVAVVPLRPTTDGWRLMLNGELALTGSMRTANERSPDG